jgi:Plasmid pRiA4b ORF-3-like protein
MSGPLFRVALLAAHMEEDDHLDTTVPGPGEEVEIMSNSRKTKRPRGTRSRHSGLRLVAGQGTVGSPRSGRLHAVPSETDDVDARAIRLDVPAIPETAAGEIHVLAVSLHGAAPPPWRLLEVPSAITLDQLHEVLQKAFGWSGFGPHSFVTIYGEFFGLGRPASRAVNRADERRDESGVMLAQAAGEDGLGMVYLYGYHDEWRVDIRVEKILPAAAGVAYPRCTGGRGEDLPRERYRGVWEFDAYRVPVALDMYFDPGELTDDLADLAAVIAPAT